MGLTITTVISGAGKYINGLKQIEPIAINELSQGVEETLNQIVDHVNVYPPESEANQPPFPYWSRGTGYIHASGIVNPVSQKYNQSWKVTVKSTANETIGRATNSATYAPWLINLPTQTSFHKRRGWHTIQDAISRLGLSKVSTRFDVNTSGEKNKLAMSINRVIDKIRKAVA